MMTRSNKRQAKLNNSIPRMQSVFINNNTTEIYYTIENGTMYRAQKVEEIDCCHAMVNKETFHEFLHRIWNDIQSKFDTEEEQKGICGAFIWQVIHNECNQITKKSSDFVRVIIDSFMEEIDIQRVNGVYFMK